MTEVMFSVDQTENDRLLLGEEQRRQDLLDNAVKSFAPNLLNTSGVKCIHLYSTNDPLRSALRDAFQGSKTILVEHCVDKGRVRKGVNEVPHDGMFIQIPKTADLVVTKSSLNKRIEWFAASLKALPCVIPESLPYIFKRLERTQALVLVGAEQGKR